MEQQNNELKRITLEEVDNVYPFFGDWWRDSQKIHDYVKLMSSEVDAFADKPLNEIENKIFAIYGGLALMHKKLDTDAQAVKHLLDNYIKMLNAQDIKVGMPERYSPILGGTTTAEAPPIIEEAKEQ